MAKSKTPEKVTTSKEKKLMEFVAGTRKPVTAEEKQLVKEIQEIKAKGRIVEIPAEIV